MTGLGIEKRNEKEPKMNGFRGVHFLQRPPYNLYTMSEKIGLL